MVRIRLKRFGRRHRPFFRISVMDQRSPRDGKAIEDIGYYDPMVRDKSRRVRLKMDRLEYWLSVGAQPSEKVAVLIKKLRQGKLVQPQPNAESVSVSDETSAPSGPSGGDGEEQ